MLLLFIYNKLSNLTYFLFGVFVSGFNPVCQGSMPAENAKRLVVPAKTECFRIGGKRHGQRCIRNSISKLKGRKMNRHKVKRNEFRLENGVAVNIEYWTDATTIHVAAFDADGHQVSLAKYAASVDAADDLTPERQEALIDSLANALEYALIRNPGLHVRQR